MVDLKRVLWVIIIAAGLIMVSLIGRGWIMKETITVESGSIISIEDKNSVLLTFDLSDFETNVADSALLNLQLNSEMSGDVIEVYGLLGESENSSGVLQDRVKIDKEVKSYVLDVSDYVNTMLGRNDIKEITLKLVSQKQSVFTFNGPESKTGNPQLVLNPSNTHGGQIKKVSDTVLVDKGLTFAEGKFNLFPNVSSGELLTYKGYQYVSYYDEERFIRMARRRSGAGQWEVLQLRDYVSKTNDSHNSVNFGIAPADGTIHLAFDHHADDLHYRVSIQGLADNPEDYEWTSDLFGPVVDHLSGNKLTAVTYPRFYQKADGNLILKYRTRGSGNGWTFFATYDAKEQVWTLDGKILHSDGTYNGAITGISTQRGHYPMGIIFDERGRLHMPFVWRETPSSLSNHDINYVYSDDGGRIWKNIQGNEVAQIRKRPITIDSEDIIVKEIPEKRGLINGSGFATVDSNGNPHFLVQHLSDTTEDAVTAEQSALTRRSFHYWFDDNNELQSINLHFGGSKSPILMADNDDAYIVYISKSFDYEQVGDRKFAKNRLRIAKATKAKGYTDWEHIYEESDLTNLAIGLRIDVERFNSDQVISVMLQEIPKKLGEATPIHVVDYRIHVE